MALATVVLATLTTFLGYIILQFAFNQETLSNHTYFNFVVPLMFLLGRALFYCLLERHHRTPVVVVLRVFRFVFLSLESFPLRRSIRL